ncbi:MAG TPA: HU family DNA-binding protein [Bryobacteraceae bacterium]|nr:HU family DNA-binding protein [Bryobacteraceae bacterium]
MNRLIRQVAKNSSVTPAQAADSVNKVVHRVLQQLKNGKQAPLPGVGVLTPGPTTQFIEEVQGDVAASRNSRQRR